MGSYAGYWLQTLVTLVVVCGAAFAVLFGARKLGVGRPSGPITLAGQLPLDGRRAVYLVRVGAQVLIVGASEAGLTKLGELPASELPAATNEPSGFAASLARAMGRTSDDSTTEKERTP
jgi:flagellar biogenesis protein FliO